MIKLARDVTINYHGSAITVPVGTALVKLADGMGQPCYAVRNAKLVMDLTGDTHTPKYYYCWVPNDAIIDAA